jgi:hypothetical protein
VKRCWERGSDRTILKCNRCEEIVVVLGREEDWSMEGHIFFECQCGQKLSVGPKPR